MVASWPIYDESLRVIALFEHLLVPLTMLWLALRWFWLVGKVPPGDVSEDLEQQLEKAARSTRRAFAGGLGMAALAVLVVMSLCPRDSPDGLSLAPAEAVLQLGHWSMLIACLAGAITGFAAWWAGHNVEKWRVARLMAWRGAVFLASAIGVSSLVTYRMLFPFFWPHAWLVWSYMFLLVTALIAYLLGD